MSYNIDTWKVKELQNLRIPKQALYTEGDRHFNKPVLNDDDETFTIAGMDAIEIIGTIRGGIVHVTEINCTGEGSGTTYRDCLLPALKQSKGVLIVACVWEGGDSITRLTVKDGDVSEENIEL